MIYSANCFTGSSMMTTLALNGLSIDVSLSSNQVREREAEQMVMSITWV